MRDACLLENTSTDDAPSLEHVPLHDLSGLLPLQREKLYALFRSKQIEDRNNPEYLQKIWETDPRWKDVIRRYAAEDVVALRGEIHVEHTLAKNGAEQFWYFLHTEPYVPALGAMTGNQAVQQVAAGLKAIYCSGWQVAADANLARSMYPDQSLYPSNSVPDVVRAINGALRRADQIQTLDGGKGQRRWLVPIMADAEAGFGGHLNAFELMKAMVDAGAAGVHFEDQLASHKKCGHLGGKVLVPTGEFITKLQAARLAADVCDAPAILMARTDADSAKLLTSDIDGRDYPFLTGGRTAEGFYRIRGGLDMAITRGLAYAPYADMLWCETSHPDLGEAREFAQAIRAEFPGKLLAYNCSPSFNWSTLDIDAAQEFQQKLGEMGYNFPFITLPGFHTLNLSMYELARAYRMEGMAAYRRLVQDREFALERSGYGGIKHQHFVGTGYFDRIMHAVGGGESELAALKGSTEEAQFASKNT